MEREVNSYAAGGNERENSGGHVIWVLSLITSISLAFVAAYCVKLLYHPDLVAISKRAARLLIGAAAARPEPVEAHTTRVCILVLGVAVPVFYLLFRRVGDRLSRPKVAEAICIAAATIPLLLLFTSFAAANPFSPATGEVAQNDRDILASTNFSFFFEGLLLGHFLLYYVAIIVPLVAAFFFWGIRRKGWDKTLFYPRVVNYVGYSVVVVLLAAIFFMNTFEFPYTYENAFDFDTVYYSMTQVFAGSPMLIDDFTNTYGLYPHFLNPLFQLTGLSILKFSFVMSLLVVLSFVLNFLVLKRMVADRVILFLGFFTLLFFPYLNAKLAVQFDSYFAMYPIRYVVPSLMSFTALWYFEKGGRLRYVAVYLMLAFSILWNPEMGLVCITAWTAANIYRDLLDAHGRVAWLAILRHAAMALLSVLVVFVTYACTIRLAYGAWPELHLLFRAMRVFGELGFNMLPMALLHPWNVVVLILLIGYLYSVAARARAVTVKSTMVFLLTVTALGFFLYFQGRSHNWSFSSSSGFAVMVLIILGDELWGHARRQRRLAFDLLFVCVLFIFSFSLPEVIYGAPDIARLVVPSETKQQRAAYQQMIESNRDFIKNNTAPHEKTLILTGAPRQGLYFDGSKRVSTFNPTTMEMFFNTSVLRLEQAVRNGPEKIFIEGADCRFGYLLRPLLVLAADYQVASKNGDMAMMVKRSELPVISYLNRIDGLLFHRKYRDGAGYTDARVRDALGSGAVTLDSSFSVAVLFKTTPQVCPTAAIVCNLGDSSGLLIEARGESEGYFFGVYGDGLVGKIDNNGWVYCVLNVFTDRLELFINGEKKGAQTLNRPYRQSDRKVRIGSKDVNSVAYYMGAIAEVAIVNRPLTPAEVSGTFAMMGNWQ